MDFRGQQFSEYLYYFLTIFFGAIAWLVGYVKNDFQVTVNGWAIGLVLALILCIPDWPMYNRYPVKWAEKASESKKKTKNKDKGAEKKELKEKKEKKEKKGKKKAALSAELDEKEK